MGLAIAGISIIAGAILSIITAGFITANAPKKDTEANKIVIFFILFLFFTPIFSVVSFIVMLFYITSASK